MFHHGHPKIESVKMNENLNTLVESRITSISFEERPQRIYFKLREPGGIERIIEAYRVDEFYCEELRPQNIIDHVNLIGKENFSEINMNDFIYILSRNYGEFSSREKDKLIESKLNSIKNGEKVFFSMEPVYGAWIGLIAESVEVRSA